MRTNFSIRKLTVTNDTLFKPSDQMRKKNEKPSFYMYTSDKYVFRFSFKHFLHYFSTQFMNDSFLTMQCNVFEKIDFEVLCNNIDFWHDDKWAKKSAFLQHSLNQTEHL